jgi:hypothetical protein
MVDQDPAHDASRDRKEMDAVLPADVLGPDQPDVRLVDERGRLKAVAGALPGQAAPRNLVELTVHERNQSLEGCLVAISPIVQQCGDSRVVVRNASNSTPFPGFSRLRGAFPLFQSEKGTSEISPDAHLDLEGHAMTKSYRTGVALAAALLGSTGPSVNATSATADVVIEWNQILQATIPVTIGPTSPRYYAMLHIAMFDAINSIEREYQPYRVPLRDGLGGSPDAAAAQAAHDVLSALFPGAKPTYDAALLSRLGSRPTGFVRRGAATGALVAQQILEWRQNDGWAAPQPAYVPPPFPGLWQPTPPNHPTAFLTHAGSVMPFALLTPTQFLPPAPPMLTSEKYAAHLNHVKLMGKSDSTLRTPEQTAIARVWAGIGANGVGTSTGMFAVWNNVTADVVRERGLSQVDAARVFVLVNVAMHDGIQSSATAKYVYGLWRAVTAIRRADEDLNDATDEDPSWLPLLVTPPYPAYPGNMACVGASAARALELAFGTNDIQVTATFRQSNGTPDVSHLHPGFAQLAEEQAISRVYGGIHYQFDSDASRDMGVKIGDFIVANYMVARR